MIINKTTPKNGAAALRYQIILNEFVYRAHLDDPVYMLKGNCVVPSKLETNARRSLDSRPREEPSVV